MAAFGRKRKSESRISSVFDVRFTLGSRHSANIDRNGRLRPKAVMHLLQVTA